MAEFIITDVTKKYEGTTPTLALHNISLTITDGEFVCFLGPSGCGKSTLLEILAGLIRPSSGNVLFDGELLQGPSRKLGFVFQDASLYSWRNVHENIELGMEICGITKAARKPVAEKYIKMVG
ncbi:MAG TPA: ATP-binding cassette domain-containing protein, partial [Negativicutes bacterium]|nr:ATP-binding cassette domain-containing protein [Negativicutes bacterium]